MVKALARVIKQSTFERQTMAYLSDECVVNDLSYVRMAIMANHDKLSHGLM